MTAAELRQRLLKLRPGVLTAALGNFDLTAKSFIAEMTTEQSADQSRVVEALELAKWYCFDCRASKLPPMLARQPWEAASTYLDRCYSAGGYR